MNVRRIVLLNVIGLIVLIGVVWFGWNYYYNTTHYVSTDNAFVEGQQIPINVEYAGTLHSWIVKAGDSVNAGQVLGKLDPSVELQQLGAAARSVQVRHAVDAAAQIMSPISGNILRLTATSGQMVAPGQPLAYVVNPQRLYVVANIDEGQIHNVNVGDTVDISISAFPTQSFKGTVQSIGLATNSEFSLIPSTDAASGTYTKVTQTIPVKITLSGYSGVQLAPGLSATVYIHRQTT